MEEKDSEKKNKMKADCQINHAAADADENKLQVCWGQHQIWIISFILAW